MGATNAFRANANYIATWNRSMVFVATLNAAGERLDLVRVLVAVISARGKHLVRALRKKEVQP